MMQRTDIRSDATVGAVGGLCAMTLGVLTAIAAITYLLLPGEQRLGEPAAELLPSFAAGGGLLRLEFWELALIGILGLAVVPALSRLVPAGGWVGWTGTIALVGFAVSAVSNLLALERLPRIADAFVAGDPSTRAALEAVWKSSLDPWGILAFGGVGAWLFALNLIGFQARTLPAPLCYLGLLLALAHVLVPVAVALGAQGLIAATAVIAALAAVIWYPWAGSIAMRRGPDVMPPRVT